jgi:hypothetical protein
MALDDEAGSPLTAFIWWKFMRRKFLRLKFMRRKCPLRRWGTPAPAFEHP